MNSLENVTLNSVNLIDERLRLLQEELFMIEKQYGFTISEKPIEKKEETQTRYQDLPKIDPEPQKTISIKPQIKEEYLKTLQYAPDIMTEYRGDIQEPQYLAEVHELIIPPRVMVENSILYTYLKDKTRSIC